MRKRFSWWRRSYTIAIVVLIAAAVRVWAAFLLPIDADEPVYMKAGSDYARLIESGNVNGVINYPENREHPALVKLIYSIPHFFIEPRLDSYPELTVNRLFSVLFGTLAVWLVALVDPLAGFLLAMHSITIKYTSQAYLEALPLFTSIASVLALEHSLRKGRKGYFWLSAIALGLTAAGKYTYLLIVVPLAVILIKGGFKKWLALLGYVLVSVSIFVAFNPTLWADPLNRFIDSLVFHNEYTTSIDVLRLSYPWYQPVLWIMQVVPWHPRVFFFLTSDEIVFFLGLVGFYWEFKKRLWSPIWFSIGMTVLLIWTTKWPQYTLILIVPLTLSAATFIQKAITWAKEKYEYWGVFDELIPQVPKKVWVLVIVLAGGLTIATIGYEIHMAMARQGWMQVSTINAPMPSDLVNDLFAGGDGSMAIATNAGVAIWNPDAKIPWGELESVRVFTPNNSDLGEWRVTTTLQDSEGNWWFGTDRALYRLRENIWTTFSLAQMGLVESSIQDLAIDSQGRLWVGTLGGGAVWDGKTWQAFLTTNSGILDNQIYSVEIEPNNGDDRIWFGSFKGISELNVSTKEWRTYDLSVEMLGWRGVSDLLLDKNGKLWTATMGGGLGEFDNGEWRFQRKSNSGIPNNTLTCLEEAQPGRIWVGYGYQTEPGGILATFDGESWRDYGPYNSGFLGYEPQAFALDSFGRLWIGTSAGGVQLFQLPDLEGDAAK